MTGVVGVVLAGGTSVRLGRPKQLLAYRGATLLDATLDGARRCGFDQLVVALGGAAPEVRATVDLSGAEVVDSVRPTRGCSSSLVAALEVVRPAVDGLVLLLGDQPGVRPEVVSLLVERAQSTDAAVAAIRYRDGRGHPLWFARRTFGDLLALQGDKAVWRLMASDRHQVLDLPYDDDVPPDVDTQADYEALLAADATGEGRG